MTKKDIQITDVPGEISSRGLSLPPGLTFEQWDRIGARFNRALQSLAWAIGDWYRYGEASYGEKAASAKAISETSGLAPESVRVYAWVAGQYEIVTRVTNLSFRHYRVAAAEENRLQWLDRAQKHGWSSRELEQQIAETKLLAEKTAAVSGKTYTPLLRNVKAHQLLESLPEGSADLLLTDPPYMTDEPNIRAFVEDWVPLALSRVKDTGRAYICCGAYPEELAAYLDILLEQKRFCVADVLVWTYRNTLGPTPEMTYKTNWQAILHLYGQKAPRLNCPVMVEQFSVQDINAPDGRQGDRLHAWQKPDELAERLIRHSTNPGEFVIDPFAGTGTFLLAAARLDRQSLGSEKDAAMFKLALRAGCKER